MPDAVREELAKMRKHGLTNPCCQIFAYGPQSYKPTLTKADREELRRLVADESIPIVIHGAYVDVPWGNSAEKGIENILRELEVADEIGATGVVIHLGAAEDDKLSYLLERIRGNKSTLWLEINAAKSCAGTYETVDKLFNLFRRIKDIEAEHGLPNVGLCIDTAHLFACGTALVTYEDASAWIDALVTKFQEDNDGFPSKFMIHLNDCMTEKGSGKDIHACIGRGKLWRDYLNNPEDSGAAAFISFCEANDLLCIFEREQMHLCHDLDSAARILGVLAAQQ